MLTIRSFSFRTCPALGSSYPKSARMPVCRPVRPLQPAPFLILTHTFCASSFAQTSALLTIQRDGAGFKTHNSRQAYFKRLYRKRPGERHSRLPPASYAGSLPIQLYRFF
jgi:hypothetical protein